MGIPAVDTMQKQFTHQIITRSDPGYDAARAVWNGMIDRRPLMVVQPVSALEVARAVALAREHDLPLSVKGGGHGVAGKAICDDGLVVDLCRMASVQVDPDSRTATVGGGATLRALDAGAQAHGLATTAGIYRQTGVAGLALGGGVGLLMRRFGLTCDNLVSAEVVTADGQILRASEQTNPNLFWALRGGGGNFGVVTEMVFQLHPLSHVLGGLMIFDFADAVELGRVYSEVMADAPDELQIYLGYSSGDGNKRASLVFCDTGSGVAGEAAIERVRRSLRPISEDIQRKPYLNMQQTWDDSFPDGVLRYWKSSFLTTISEDLLRVCQEAVARAAFPSCDVDLEPMGGAISRIAPDATAFADRDAASTLLITSGWTDPAESDARIAWARTTFAAAQPYSNPTVNINYLGQGDEDRVVAAFSSNYERLRQIKRIYDPDNMFRFNANIRP
jgi:FAD/FMN-containing dehydrogenase